MINLGRGSSEGWISPSRKIPYFLRDSSASVVPLHFFFSIPKEKFPFSSRFFDSMHYKAKKYDVYEKSLYNYFQNLLFESKDKTLLKKKIKDDANNPYLANNLLNLAFKNKDVSEKYLSATRVFEINVHRIFFSGKSTDFSFYHFDYPDDTILRILKAQTNFDRGVMGDSIDCILDDFDKMKKGYQKIIPYEFAVDPLPFFRSIEKDIKEESSQYLFSSVVSNFLFKMWGDEVDGLRLDKSLELLYLLVKRTNSANAGYLINAGETRNKVEFLDNVFGRYLFKTSNSFENLHNEALFGFSILDAIKDDIRLDAPEPISVFLSDNSPVYVQSVVKGDLLSDKIEDGEDVSCYFDQISSYLYLIHSKISGEGKRDILLHFGEKIGNCNFNEVVNENLVFETFKPLIENIVSNSVLVPYTDSHSGNIMVGDDSKIIFLDNEDLGKVPLAYDVGKLGFFLPDIDSRIRYLDSYFSINPKISDRREFMMKSIDSMLMVSFTSYSDLCSRGEVFDSDANLEKINSLVSFLKNNFYSHYSNFSNNYKKIISFLEK